MGILYMIAGAGAYYSDEIGQFIAPSVGNPTLQTYQHLFFHWMNYAALLAVLLYISWRGWRRKDEGSSINEGEKNQ